MARSKWVSDYFMMLLGRADQKPLAAMLWIHRSYFAKALLDYPLNPLKSPYATSFLSAYRSSLSLLKLAREHYALSPNFMVRSWMLWKHVFSALVSSGQMVLSND
jgi:hypothetical protein